MNTFVRRLRYLLKSSRREAELREEIEAHRAHRQDALERPMMGLRGNENRKIYDLHYEGFLKQGWAYLKPGNFVHHCTDGPECPIAFAFSKAEARQLFSRFLPRW